MLEGRRHPLREKEKKVFLQTLVGILGVNTEVLLGERPQVEVIQTLNCEIYLISGVALAFRSNEGLMPTLLFDGAITLLPKVVVDMGALPHICNGADLMAPGIVEVQGKFKEKDLVAIIDEKHRKPIAVSRSFFDSETLKGLRQGKVLKNLHYVGDEIWNLAKNLARNEKVKT